LQQPGEIAACPRQIANEARANWVEDVDKSDRDYVCFALQGASNLRGLPRALDLGPIDAVFLLAARLMLGTSLEWQTMSEYSFYVFVVAHTATVVGLLAFAVR